MFLDFLYYRDYDTIFYLGDYMLDYYRCINSSYAVEIITPFIFFIWAITR